MGEEKHVEERENSLLKHAHKDETVIAIKKKTTRNRKGKDFTYRLVDLHQRVGVGHLSAPDTHRTVQKKSTENSHKS